jgi:predicted nuclease with TOPRIM domain
MAALPFYDPTEIATRADLRNLEGRFDQLEARFDQLEVSFDQLETRFDHMEARFDRLEVRFDVLSQRLDRLFLTSVAGLIVIVGATAGTVFLP